MNDRSLTCCKLSRRTPFQAELTSHPAIPVGISDVSMRLMPTRRVSGEYSRGKVPNVVVFSTVGYGTFTPRSAGAASCGRLDRIRRQPRQPTASFRWSTLESRDADKNLAANALFKTQVDAHRCLLASGWEKALPPGVENSSNLPKGNDDWYYHPTKRQPAKKSKNP